MRNELAKIKVLSKENTIQTRGGFSQSPHAGRVDAFNRFVFGALPMEKEAMPTAAPPSEAFEAAGFAVREAAWDCRPVRVSRFPCPYPGARNPRVEAFRRRHGFLKHIAKGRSEVEKLLLLREWVRRQFKFGEDSPELDPFVILDGAARGRKFVCTQYAVVMQACAVAAGWVSCDTHIDWDHTAAESSHSHAVTEVWINDLGKWVVFDVMYDVHYEKDGIMLSAAEVGREWVADGGKRVVARQGPKRRKVAGVRARVLGGKPDPAGYFWNKRVWTWDPFSSFGTVEPDMQLALLSDYHEGKQWYQGRPPNAYVLHAIRRGALLFTRREADAYPDIGACSLSFAAGEHIKRANGRALDALVETAGRPAVSWEQKGRVRVSVETFTPGLEAVLVSADGRARPSLKAARRLRFDWLLHEGENTLSVRSRNEFGILGKPANVRVVLRAK